MAQKFDVSKMRVASPCRIGWDSMTGDDRARFCGNCDRQVYNIVGLTRPQIESLVENTEGRLCVRMYQRPDATVLTEDCPVGLRLIRKRVATFAGAAFSALLGLVSVGYGQDTYQQSRSNVSVERVKIDSGWSEISGLVIDPTGAIVSGAEVFMKGLGFERHAKTDADGKFRFESLRPDLRYELSIEIEGFTKHIVRELDPTKGEGLAIKVQLQPRKSQPHAPVEENFSPVAIDGSSASDLLSTQPVDSCPRTERKKVESKYGQVTGTITDPMGAVVPGLKLRLQLDKRLISTATSDATGYFSFSEIKPANGYTIRIDDQQGWKKQLIEGITVNGSEKIIYDICIQVGNVYEVVGSYGQPTQIQVEGTKPADDVFKRKP